MKPSTAVRYLPQKQPELVKGRNGRPKWCVDNACQIMEHNSDWAGVFAYDEFSVLVMVLRPIPGTTAPRSTFASRELRDNDVTAAVRWFNRNGFPDATKNVMQDAIQDVARKTVLSPVRDYLEGLKWDGTSRIDNWLQYYCEASDDRLVKVFGRKWLIATVARALRPGCKADNALVLEGAQGAGKSSALKALAGEAWFFDGLRDMHGKDASASLKGKWIVELPELSALRRSDVESVKAFLSRTDERYRPPYGRGEVIEPRRCIFAGTTNRNDYIADDTGGRRFWPVKVGRINVEGLERDRDQIWAEAVAAFKAGEQWWLSAEDEVEAAAIVADRQSDDLWSGKVLSAAAGLPEVSTAQIVTMIGITLEQCGKSEAMRIAGILTRAGWRKDGKFKTGPYKDLSRYLPPPVKGSA
jgi:predicted P-loop ATPase